MAITTSSQANYMSVIDHAWGFILIGNEIFVISYDDISNVKVYNIETKSLLRTLSIVTNCYALSTDGTNLLIKNSSNQIVTINKDTGTIISTKTDATFDIHNFSATFKLDIQNDRIYYTDYSNTMYIKKYSDGSLIKSYSSFPIYTTGVEIIGRKYVLVSCYSHTYIAEIVNNDVTNLIFSEITPPIGIASGIVYYNKKLYFTTYSTNIISVDVLGLENAKKYLIKQNSNYYTINTINYDAITSHNFIPLTLDGGVNPNYNDIDKGFDDLSVLTNSMNVGDDTFSPINKFDNTAELKMYKLI